jgi:hypothetical protein
MRAGIAHNCLRANVAAVRAFQVKYLESLLPSSKRALKELRSLLGDTNVTRMFSVPRPGGGKPLVGFLTLAVEDAGEEGHTAALDAGFPMQSAAQELLSTGFARSHRTHDKPISHRRAIEELEDELLEDELLANELGKSVAASMLMPCEAPNVGFPDEENRGLSMRLKVRTVLVGGPAADFIISRNPARHIGLREVSTSVYGSPVFKSASSTGVNNDWRVNGEPAASVHKPGLSYLQATGESMFSVLDGCLEGNDQGWFNEGADNPPLSFGSRPYVMAGGSIGQIKVLPVTPGDLISINGETNDTTANNYQLFVRWYETASQSLVEQTASATGGANSTPGWVGAGSAFACPSGCDGLVNWGIRNIGGVASTFAHPDAKAFLTMAISPVWLPIGDASGQDLSLLLENANDVRCVGCRATATYIGEKLENGTIVAGQPPLPGDAELPDPTLADLATTIGMKPMALNGVNPGASFPIWPLTEDEMRYAPIQTLYDQNEFGEGLIKYTGTTTLAEAVILQTEMSLQARTERQTLMCVPGEVSLRAVSDFFSFIGECNYLDFVTGNDDHEEVAAATLSKYEDRHPSFSFLNGNSISLNLTPW